MASKYDDNNNNPSYPNIQSPNLRLASSKGVLDAGGARVEQISIFSPPSGKHHVSAPKSDVMFPLHLQSPNTFVTDATPSHTAVTDRFDYCESALSVP